jgi:hypothetical protein
VSLGCTSSVYLLYGLVATTVWFLQVLSAHLSHTWAKRCESGLRHTRSLIWISLGALAVYTRLIANTLAILNSLFLVTISTMTITNIAETSWCFSAPSLLASLTWVPTQAIAGLLPALSWGYWVLKIFWGLTFVFYFFKISLEKKLSPGTPIKLGWRTVR